MGERKGFKVALVGKIEEERKVRKSWFLKKNLGCLNDWPHSFN
jgi:hypothetical protein